MTRASLVFCLPLRRNMRCVQAWAMTWPPVGLLGSPYAVSGLACTWLVRTTERLKASATLRRLPSALASFCWRSARVALPMYSPLKWPIMLSTMTSLTSCSCATLGRFFMRSIWWSLL